MSLPALLLFDDEVALLLDVCAQNSFSHEGYLARHSPKMKVRVAVAAA